MRETLITASLSSIVVLSSVLLAICQYFSNNLKSRFDALQIRLSAAFDALAAITTELSESKKRHYDELRILALPGVLPHMVGVFGIIVGCAILVLLNLITSFFGDRPYVWLVPPILIPAIMIILTAAYTIIAPWAGKKLYDANTNVRELERTVVRWEDELRVANTVAAAGRRPARGGARRV